MASLGDSLALQLLLSLRPSRNIRRDEDLSWDEMVTAKNNMIYFMVKSKLWPQSHIECVAKFYVALETHPIHQSSHGNRIVTAYAGRARCKWFDTLKMDEGFNLAIINAELMKSVADEIKDFSRDEEMAAVSTCRLFFEKYVTHTVFFLPCTYYLSNSLCINEPSLFNIMLRVSAVI